MDCSRPGFPVHHYLPESAQIHVHWVSDVIQPSCPLASNHLTISRLFFYSVEMYTAIICCYSNHTNLLQLVSTYFLGYSLRNNITAMGMIRMLDCDDFHFVYDTFPSPVIWWHHHLYFEGCMKRRTVWREWSFMVSTCTGESHCLVGLVTGLFVGDTISVSVGQEQIALFFSWILSCRMWASDGQLLNLQ